MHMTHEGLWGHGWVIWKLWVRTYIILGGEAYLFHIYLFMFYCA